MRVEYQPDVSSAYALYKQDEILAKKNQQEGNDLAAHVPNLLRRDAELGKSLTSNAGVQIPPASARHGKRRAVTSTAVVLTTTSPAHMYRSET